MKSAAKHVKDSYKGCQFLPLFIKCSNVCEEGMEILHPIDNEIRHAKLIEVHPRQRLSQHKINLPANQKAYDNFETTVGKLSARSIQICLVRFYKSRFGLFF